MHILENEKISNDSKLCTFMCQIIEIRNLTFLTFKLCYIQSANFKHWGGWVQCIQKCISRHNRAKVFWSWFWIVIKLQFHEMFMLLTGSHQLIPTLVRHHDISKSTYFVYFQNWFLESLEQDNCLNFTVAWNDLKS